MLIRRLNKELAEYTRNPDPDIQLFPSDDIESSLHLKAILNGPPDTPYFGANFAIDITLPKHYPFQTPKIQFVHPIFHPKIDLNRNTFCIPGQDTDWKESWNPTCTIASTLKELKRLFSESNFHYFYNMEAAHLHSTDESLYHYTVREWSIKYAIPSKWRSKLQILWCSQKSDCILAKLPVNIVRSIIDSYI